MKFLLLVFVLLFLAPKPCSAESDCMPLFEAESLKEISITFIDDAGEIKKLLGSNWAGDIDNYTKEVSKMAQTYDVQIGVKVSSSKSFSYYHLSILGPYDRVKQFLTVYYKKFFTGLTPKERARRIENALNR